MNPFEHHLGRFTEQLNLKHRSSHTIYNYTFYLKRFFAWLTTQGVFDIREVNALLLTQYQSRLSTRYPNPHTLHMILRSLINFFAFLEQTSALLYNPAEKLSYPKLGKRLPKDIPTEAEMKRLLAAPNLATRLGMRDRAILELLYSTGLRLTECTKLTLYDIDTAGGYLRVNQSKGRKDRVVPLGTKACEHLRHYLLKIRPGHAEKKPDEHALFLTCSGRPLSRNGLVQLMRRYRKRTGIKKPLSVQSIRRAFATHLLRNNAHPLYIQRLLGHATPETINKYIKVTGSEVKKTHKKTHPREKDKR